MNKAAEFGLEPGLMSNFIDAISEELSNHLVGSSRSIARDMVDEVRAYHWSVVPNKIAPHSLDRTRFVAQMTELMFEIWATDNTTTRIVVDKINYILDKMQLTPVQTQYIVNLRTPRD